MLPALKQLLHIAKVIAKNSYHKAEKVICCFSIIIILYINIFGIDTIELRKVVFTCLLCVFLYLNSL